jgi:hypothetical protein
VTLIDQRRNQRYDLRLPFELVRTGSQQVTKTGETRNLSSSGVLFTSDVNVEVGQPIEFVITLPTKVRIRCIGKVVRREALTSDLVPANVAATLERFEFVRATKQ